MATPYPSNPRNSRYRRLAGTVYGTVRDWDTDRDDHDDPVRDAIVSAAWRCWSVQRAEDTELGWA